MIDPYYVDEYVTLYHGDCLELADLWTCADVLVTDPPYGIDWKAGCIHYRRSTRSTAESSIVGDSDTGARDDMLSAWGTGRPAVVFGSWRIARPDRVTHRLIWHKAGRKPGVSPAAFFPSDEEVYLIGTGWQGRPTPTVITTTEAREQQPRAIGHPTPKPLDLMGVLVGKSPPGVIADPFAGSGSTLVAAKRLGRQAIGVEIDERYCEIASRRLSQGVLDFGA